MTIHKKPATSICPTRTQLPLRRKSIFRAALLTGVVALGISSPAFAQQDTGTARDTAKPQDVISPGGVSYANGAFSWKLPLVSIGGGEFPRSLSYGLWYNSGSARLPNMAWTHNLTMRTSRTLFDDPIASDPDWDGQPRPEQQVWEFNVVVGQRSEPFRKLHYNPATGVYKPVTANGSTLTFTGTSTAGYHTFTGSRGEVIKFRPIENTIAPGGGDYWQEPDGTKLTYQYTADSMTVSNNLGYALFMEPPTTVQTGIFEQDICVLNLTQHYLPSITACPSGAPTSRVRSTALTQVGYKEVSSITLPDGGIYNLEYSQSTRGSVTRRALSCIKKPGSSNCSVANTYDTCDQLYEGDPVLDMHDSGWTGSRDRVVSQLFEGGQTIAYSWPTEPGCRQNPQVSVTDALNAVSLIKAAEGLVSEVKDPLLRQSLFTYGGSDPLNPQLSLLKSATSPEGDRTEYTYDGRGNATTVTKKAKPGSGLADIVTSATFPSTCDNRVTCNQPTTRTDARGGVTDYTYDPVHGGLLTETGPAPASGQPRPQTRHSYAQRYAWISNGSGGYVQAASPVWVLTAKSLCKTSAATGNPSTPCSVSGDEVKTTYDYGPDSGPNNLLLRGIVEDAGGLNLRTCYGYDSLGRKISETKPRAGLSSCP